VSALGSVAHVVIGPQGDVDYPIVGNWVANEDAQVGCLGASGVIAAARKTAKPGVYTDGAIWRTFHRESGRPLWGGRLAEPTIEAGVARLLGRGWGEVLAEREIGPLLYESRSTRNFELSYAAGTKQSWTAEVGASIIWFTRNENAAATSTSSQVNVTGWWEEQSDTAASDVDLYQLRFRLMHAGSFGTRCRLQIRNRLGNLLYDQVIDGALQDGVVTVDLTQTTASIYVGPTWRIELIVSNDSTGFTIGTGLALSDIRVSGIPGGADLTDGGLIRDVAERIDVAADVTDKGISVLPFYPGVASVKELLERASLFSGYSARFLDTGSTPLLVYGPWGTQTWLMAEPRQPLTVHELDRYDRVVLTGEQRVANSILSEDDFRPTRWQRTVTLSPSPLDTPRTYGPIDLPEIIDSVEADPLAEHLLSVLSRRRFAGDGHFAELVDADTYAVGSAHLLHAGDTVFDSMTAAWLPVASLHRTEAGVDVTFGNEVEAAVERVLARERGRIRQRR
jgi:hypothetical protein